MSIIEIRVELATYLFPFPALFIRCFCINLVLFTNLCIRYHKLIQLPPEQIQLPPELIQIPPEPLHLPPELPQLTLEMLQLPPELIKRTPELI